MMRSCRACQRPGTPRGGSGQQTAVMCLAGHSEDLRRLLRRPSGAVGRQRLAAVAPQASGPRRAAQTMHDLFGGGQPDC